MKKTLLHALTNTKRLNPYNCRTWAFQNALKLNLIECINAIADDIMASLKVKQDVDRVIEEIVSEVSRIRKVYRSLSRSWARKL